MSPPVSWLCVSKRSFAMCLWILFTNINVCVISYAARAPSWPGANFFFF